jgi:hypothetical protein
MTSPALGRHVLWNSDLARAVLADRLTSNRMAPRKSRINRVQIFVKTCWIGRPIAGKPATFCSDKEEVVSGAKTRASG